MVPDTGSSNLWVYSHRCIAIPCWTHPTFNAGKSTTYKGDPKTPFVIHYGSGGIQGTLAHDTASIGDGSIKATSMGFGEITKVQGVSFIASKMSGIIGLGYDTISIDNLKTFMDIATVSEKSFSMYLHSNPDKSYMVVPGADTENWSAIHKHIVKEQKYWALNLKGMKQGTKAVPADGIMAVIDSGTSLLVGSKAVVGPLIEGISVAADCSNVDSNPDITFTIDEVDYTLKPAEYVLKVTELGQTECLLGIQAANLPANFHYIILGDVFMRKFPALFSLEDNSVTFMGPNAKKVEETLY